MSAGTVHIQTRRVAGPWVDVDVPFRFAKRDVGGWEVFRSDTGQHLGWVTPTTDADGWPSDTRPRTGWKAHMPLSAFYAADADIMERSKMHPRFRGADWATAETAGWGRTREEAVHELLYCLLIRSAEAVSDLFDAAEAEALKEATA